MCVCVRACVCVWQGGEGLSSTKVFASAHSFHKYLLSTYSTNVTLVRDTEGGEQDAGPSSHGPTV